MTTEYEHDWEDPRLAVEGFVTDYIVWRLEKEELEWHESPDIPEGADAEHRAMRTMCEIFEERNRDELMMLNEDLDAESLSFAKYSEVVEQFGKSETDIPSEMTYGRMVGLIAFAGLICVEKARIGARRDIGSIALYTSKFIDSNIRLTWVESMRSWASFMTMTRQVVDRHARSAHRPSAATSRLPPSARHSTATGRPSTIPPSTPSNRLRRSSLLCVAAAVVGVGAFVAGRALMKTH